MPRIGSFMVKKLRWAGLLGFLSLPVILYLGRPVQSGCEGARGPCDPLRISPSWLGPAVLAALGATFLFLLLAAVANHRTDDEMD
jgi:hypothetical protein